MKVEHVLALLLELNIKHLVQGDTEKELTGFSSIYQYRPSTITWLRNMNVLERKSDPTSETYTCIVVKTGMPAIEGAGCQLWVDDPKKVFFDIVDYFWGEKEDPSISPAAIIEDGAVVGKNVSIGPCTYISSKSVIGDRCRIGANVTIRGKVRIGNDCTIQSGAVIGEDGFAFIKEGDTPIFVKHYGGVTIEDHVSIGAQTCVCRGAIDDTYIKKYAKIDDLCYIAHNAVIGRSTIIAAGTVVMGSVRIGDNCWVATSMIRDQRQVGDGVVVGMGSVVVKDVPDAATVAGNPAKPFERKEKI